MKLGWTMCLFVSASLLVLGFVGRMDLLLLVAPLALLIGFGSAVARIRKPGERR